MDNSAPSTQDKGDPELRVEFPQQSNDGISQDEEWCLVHLEGEVRRIRFHDYDEIFAIPGLYEQIFYQHLKCRSPHLIASMLQHEVVRNDAAMEDLRVLDVGAGNGIMGEVLADQGVEDIVGVDILDEAAQATQRDRPGVYKDYHSVDMMDMSDDVREDLESQDFNCMTLIAALGFGDIPTEVFSEAYNLVKEDGWVAFNIKHEFFTNVGKSEFSQLINSMIESKWFKPTIRMRYVHRLSITGKPLEYMAFVGRKVKDIPASYLS